MPSNIRCLYRRMVYRISSSDNAGNETMAFEAYKINQIAAPHWIIFLFTADLKRNIVNVSSLVNSVTDNQRQAQCRACQQFAGGSLVCIRMSESKAISTEG